LFAFGHGLSYTTFEYGKLGTDKNTYRNGETMKLSMTLKNTGALDGAEVVQIYASQKNPSVLRPAKELKAFQKVFLKAGETRRIELEIPVANLAFYDEKTHDWKVESDEYVLKSASSAVDLRGSASIKVK